MVWVKAWEEESLDHLRRSVGILRGIQRQFVGHAFAPAFGVGADHLDEQYVARRLCTERRAERSDQREVQLMKNSMGQFHDDTFVGGLRT